ncbi:hypothetical protein GF348_04115 [candidate division KSB3 bacterium]|nr:hypothetical protein [candidate division KSB3 bacterium]
MADLYIYHLHMDPVNLIATVSSRYIPHPHEILRIQHFNNVVMYAEVLNIEHEIRLTMHKSGQHTNRVNITVREVDFVPGRI